MSKQTGLGMGRTGWLTVAGVGWLWASSVCASVFVYTNAPCVYLISSNASLCAATLLGPTGTVTGTLSVPAFVKSSLFPVTSIAPAALKDCGAVTSVSLDAASCVSVIGAGAFWGCTNLSSVTLRASVTDLGESAFLGCSALTSVDLSVATGLASVAGQTFCGCSKLASVSFPFGVTNVGESAFRKCSALVSVTLPSSVRRVADAAFQGCLSLSSVSFAGVFELGVNAFADTGLVSVSVPSGLTAVPQGAFANCTNLVSVSYAGAPLTIGSAAFKNCAALTELPISETVTMIDNTAFDGCSKVLSAALPEGVREVQENLFENCASLQRVTLSSGVTNVFEHAFAHCGVLTNVTFDGDAPIADDAVFDTSESVYVYYYQGASGWGNLLAERPTVMLGADGTVTALSFAAWAVQNDLSSVGALSASSLETLFAADSSVAGVPNGVRYACGSNLTEADASSLLRIVFDEDGRPIVETPAPDAASAAFVSFAVLGTTDMSSGTWDLTLEEVPLTDATRAGFSPVATDDAWPTTAFFKLRLLLNE